MADVDNTGAMPESGAGADFSFLPEGLESLGAGYEKPEEFWAEASSALHMAKEKALMTGNAPTSFVDDEQREAFWRQLGKPETAEGYQFPDAWTGKDVPEDIAARVSEVLAADKAEMQQIFHAVGMTGKQAEALFDQVGMLLARSFGEEGAAPDAGPNAGTAADPGKAAAEVMAKLWPQDTAANLDQAKRGAQFLGIGDELDAAGLSLNPLVLRMAHALGELSGEDVRREAGGMVNALPTGEAALAEMHTIIKSDAYRANDPVAVKRVMALAERVKR